MEQSVMQLYYNCGFCLFLALLVHVLLRAMSGGRPRLPPGPWQLPIIGSLHHLPRGLPHHTMRDLSLRHGPVMLIRICELAAVVVSSAEAAREVFTEHGTAFEQRPSSRSIDEACSGHRTSILFAPYGERWRLLRRILVTELLSARRVQSFRRVREEEAARLVSSLTLASAGGRVVNVGGLLAGFVADSSVRAIFGNRLPAADRAAYLEVRKRGTDLSSLFDLRDLFPSSRLVRMLLPRSRKAQQHRQEVSRLMDGILRHHEERRATCAENAGGERDEDMIDVLLRVQNDGAMPSVSLSPAVIKAVVTEVFGAALDTSTITLQWAMAELVANPRVMEKAQLETRRVLAGKERVQEAALGELRYLKAVIKETLRLHPPTALVTRLCLEHGQKVQGYDVPYGTMIVANVWAISRDPRYWKDPSSFVPERFEEGDECGTDLGGSDDFKFMPFGAGRRICPGINFAGANIEIALASLVYHFDWELPSGGGIDMTEAFGVSVKRKAELMLQPIPRIRPTCI
ncbi:hypothetical protein BS78_05G178200 [Paspalum vaginatum]|nr:hypothetical protein BS78_05G178200 [Paspalum vaginatum]